MELGVSGKGLQMGESSEEEEYYLFKILLLGDAAVGKTCLMLRFCEDKFVEQHNPTIGVDFRIRSTMQILESKIKLQIWDPHPPNKFNTLRGSYYRGAHGIIILHDPSQPLANLQHWLQETDRFCWEYVSKIIVASKCDLLNKMQVGGIEKLAAGLGITFMKVSAKDSINCEECFMHLVYEILLKRIELDAQHRAKMAKYKNKSE